MNRKDFEAAKVTRQCTTFIKGVIENAKADGVVIGLSGGLDSAVVATLCVKALGNVKLTEYRQGQKGLFGEAKDFQGTGQ